jgi:hypothetical protein
VRFATQVVFDLIECGPQVVFSRLDSQGSRGHGGGRMPGGHSYGSGGGYGGSGHYQSQSQYPHSYQHGASRANVPPVIPPGTLGLGSDGSAGQLLPPTPLPNGLQHQVITKLPSIAVNMY